MLAFNETTPDINGNLKIYPVDPNSVGLVTFYLLVLDEKKPNPNVERFGPYSLNKTCDNNVINPILNISGQAGVNHIELYQGAWTTEQNEYEILFNNFSVSLQYCEIVSYDLSLVLQNVVLDGFYEYTEVELPLFGAEGFNMTFKTEIIKDYIFKIRA